MLVLGLYTGNAMNFTIIDIEFLKTWYFLEYRNLGNFSVGPSFSTPQKRSTWNLFSFLPVSSIPRRSAVMVLLTAWSQLP
jgi:hypothetical protein